MSSENGWIWWNYRTDLKEYYLVVTYEYCFSTRKDYFPLKQKIPETRFNQVLNKIEEIASRYYTRKLSSFLSVQLVSYNDCTPEQKCTLKLYDKKYRELNYIENSSNFLIAEVLTAIEIIEELDKEEFENGIIDVDCETVSELESASVPADNDSPAIPAAVASVPFSGDSPAVPASAPVADVPVDITSIRPYPQIFAQGDEAASTFDNSGAAGMIVAGNTARTADGIEALKNIFREGFEKLIEIGQQIANSLASINGKFPGKITDLDAIPPYSPTNIRWVLEKDYAKITGINNLDTMRPESRGGLVSDDRNSGIHGGHIWRAVGEGKGKNGRRIYYYIQDWLMIKLMSNINSPLT